MSRRYDRAQFLKDAVWMGLPPDAAFSRVELRRQRDQLMIHHHPDLGGDVKKAARINATYGRMMDWLNDPSARRAERNDARTVTRAKAASPASIPGAAYRSGFAAAFHVGAAQLGAVALVALATYAAFRGPRKP